MRLSSQSGFSLIQSIIAIGVLGVMSLSFLGYFDYYLKHQGNVNFDSQIAFLRQLIQGHVNNGEAWRLTLQHTDNSFRSCQEDLSLCPHEQPEPFILSDAASNVIINPTDVAAGFSPSNQVCSGYPDAAQCPVQVRSNWNVVCGPNGVCSQAQLNFQFFSTNEVGEEKHLSEYDFSINKNIVLPSTAPGTRTVTFPVTSSVTTLFPRLKLFLIVDNSHTMLDNQTKLKNGVSNMLNQLVGYNVDIYVYTTTSLPEFSDTNVAGDPVRDPTKSFTLSSTPVWTLTDGTTIVGGSEPADWEYKDYMYELNQDLGRYLGLDMSIDYTDTDLSSVVSNVMQAIDYAGTDGSGYESGLCTLMRIVQDGAVVKEGDKAAFVILSDEDDTMSAYTGGKCFKSDTHIRSESLTAIACDPSVESCDKKDYSFEIVYYTPDDYPAGYTPVNSTDVIPEPSYLWEYSNRIAATWEATDQDGWIAVDLCSSTVESDCPPRASSSCTQSDIDKAEQAIYDQFGLTNATVVKCYIDRTALRHISYGRWLPLYDTSQTEMRVAYTGRFDTTSLYGMDETTQEYQDLYDAMLAEDKCTNPFYHGQDVYDPYTETDVFVERTWSNLTEWAEGMFLAPVKAVENCTHNYYNMTDSETIESNYHRSYHPTKPPSENPWYRLVTDPGYPAFLEDMASRTESVLGPNGYSLTSIIHDPDLDSAAGCSVTDGSYGSTYKQYMPYTPTPSQIQSICEATYDSGLDQVKTFIKETSFETMYVTDLQDNEEITGVELVRNGSPVLLDASTDYTITGPSVQFASGILQDGDEVVVTISSI